jgi:acetyltransferase-like isoleucine patch superfamily enzyme
LQSIRRFLSFLACAFLPRVAKPWVLSTLGHRVHRTARVGPCFVWGTKLILGERSLIRPFNVIACRRLVMRYEARVMVGNVIRGPLSVRLGPRSLLGNFNWVARASAPVTIGPARLFLGELSGFTSRHSLDCTASITIGSFTTFAGRASQLWTHGYVHHLQGPGRFRLDGKITVGNNVYIGSGSCVTAGVRIVDGVSVAPFSSVTRSLLEPGLYFGQNLAHVARLPEDRHRGLALLAPELIEETVYWKADGGSHPLAAPSIDAAQRSSADTRNPVL